MRGVWRMVCGTWHVVAVPSPTKRHMTLWNIQYCEVGDQSLSRENPSVALLLGLLVLLLLLPLLLWLLPLPALLLLAAASAALITVLRA